MRPQASYPPPLLLIHASLLDSRFLETSDLDGAGEGDPHSPVGSPPLPENAISMFPQYGDVRLPLLLRADLSRGSIHGIGVECHPSAPVLGAN